MVGNSPYIDPKDTDICKSVKEFEPNIALFSEDNGLHDIKIIINQASKYLKQEGLVFVEHGYSQANNVREIFNQSGFVNVNTAKDLAGKDRVSLGMVEWVCCADFPYTAMTPFLMGFYRGKIKDIDQAYSVLLFRIL